MISKQAWNDTYIYKKSRVRKASQYSTLEAEALGRRSTPGKKKAPQPPTSNRRYQSNNRSVSSLSMGVNRHSIGKNPQSWRPTAAMPPKRKHSELQAPARSDTRKLSIKALRLATKFDQGVQMISRGLKTARGFERQKLSRREKTAKDQNNTTTLSRLAEEIEALKVCTGLDALKYVILTHLVSTVARLPNYRRAIPLQATIQDEAHCGVAGV